MAKFACLDSLIDAYNQPRPLEWDTIFSQKGLLRVEIGFGLGEVLLRQARDYQKINYLGIEENWERIYKTLKTFTHDSYKTGESVLELSNIKILGLDARIAFERLFVPKSIDHIYCLFPCPWPKKSHIKNRLFSASFLRLLNSRLKTRKNIRLVTDFKPFTQWVVEQNAEGDTGFEIEEEIIKPQFATKFERKWQSEGQKEFYQLTFYKQRHVSMPVIEDFKMKSYKLKKFNPDKFNFKNCKERNVSVIFKNKLYDQKMKEMVVLLTVCEGHITQHVRVSIVWKGEFWRVVRTQGQKFFPTPGIVQAINMVNEAAQATVL